MSSNTKFFTAAAVAALLSLSAHAAEDTALNAVDRTAIVQALVAKLNANYIEPDIAARVGQAIARKNADGGYANEAGAQSFSAALAKDLREFSGDLHFGVKRDESFREFERNSAPPSRAEMEEAREATARWGYGIEKVERLPGNVGYIELRGFGSTEFVGPAFTSAISLMVGTEALIVDLRRNGGGSPASVAYFMSHFIPHGDQRHLIDMFNRPEGTTRQFWTVPTVTVRYDKPVYVLTSGRTFSGGEDCAYDFQALKRGTLVGETTGGGSNPVGWFGLGHGMIVAIPTSRTTNYITKTNWEHVGVKPDIAVPAAEALRTAHAGILRTLIASAKDEKERGELQRVLAMVEKGETEKPVYTLRGERKR
ncbi:MAG TPA: S41 family peptidase [Telluria sp.]|nr:S41 family peptidase [Telluria sp.]